MGGPPSLLRGVRLRDASDMSISALPLPAPTSAAAPTPVAPVRVLLVAPQSDGESDTEQLLNDASDFSTCGRCHSLAAALEALHAARPDVVVTDMVLADGDAFELLRRMCKQQPGVRVLVLSVRHEALCAERLLRAGALGYVMRSAPGEEIRRATRRVAAGEMHISAALGLDFQRRFVHPDMNAFRTPGCALEVLSTREYQIFQLIGNGMTQTEISTALCLSVKTVESHRQHIRDKLSLVGVTQFARCALECAKHCRLERGEGTTCELDPSYRPLPGTTGFGLGT